MERRETMRQIALIMMIFSLSLWSGCKSPPAAETPPVSVPEENDFWDTTPLSGELIFHGAAGVRSKREESIRLALEDAARRAAIFTRVEGQFVSYANRGAGFFDYSSEAAGSLWYDENYKNYIEDLIFDPAADVIEERNTVFVRTRYHSPVPAAIRYQSSSFHRDSKPGWVDNPPEISGYVAGVGYAGRRSSHGDTVKASYENAVFSIIKTLFGAVSGTTEEFRGSGTFDFSSASENIITARGVLKGFYTLDFWTDPVNHAVWTLAIARTEG
jgi:hypothetical protein